MSIRIRTVDGVTIAICAARSIPKPDDIYLDDAAHHALSNKFSRDFTDEGWGSIPFDECHVPIVESEESNNANRVDWEKIFGLRRKPCPPQKKRINRKERKG